MARKKAGLSKSRIIVHRQCPKRLWLQTFRPELAVQDDATSARLAIGHQVGEVARRLFPDGVLVDEDDLSAALEVTTELLARKPRRPIFEATVEHDGVLVRADVLVPAKRGWRLIEVKSSTRVKPYYVDDAAIQTWVFEEAGVRVASTEIGHVDTNIVYRGRGAYDGLLAFADIRQEVSERQAEVPKWIAAARKTLKGGEPAVEPGSQCSDPFDCPFAEYCTSDSETEAYPVEILPNARGLAAQLRAEGYGDLRQVPAARLQNPVHRRVWRATRSGIAFRDPDAKDQLSRFPYPRYYLDFETIGFAVPQWKGTRPYQQVPFQWSCHVQKRSGGSLTHRAFLASGTGDPRREFAESLLAAAGRKGTIFAYNAGFERGRLRDLALTFDDLAAQLNAVAERVEDLLPITRTGYYHRDMRGSWSIKAVLPTIDPDFSYESLAVGDGAAAQEAYLEMVSPDTSPERRIELRTALEYYCAQDTMAMVRLVQYLEHDDVSHSAVHPKNIHKRRSR